MTSQESVDGPNPAEVQAGESEEVLAPATPGAETLGSTDADDDDDPSDAPAD